MGGSRSSSSPLSDERFKKNIHTITDSLNKVLALRGVSFDWRANDFVDMNFDNKRHIGLIAQEVEELVPEVIDNDYQGLKRVEYGHLVALLIEAIKEQQRHIEKLKESIQELRGGANFER
jgi:hypothetical protein